MSATVGYYVHHVGRGHQHRATALARHLAATGGPSLTGLSSLPRPHDWPGDWVELARDDTGETREPTARGRLHWAPRHHDGLRTRTAQVSAWIESARPDAVVVDVSVEVVLLARLHGVPVVSVVQPGRRDDPAHLLGFDAADALVAFWPAEAHGMLLGVAPETRDRLRCVGALSRFPVHASPAPTTGRRAGRHAVLLLGAGGHADPAVPDGDWHWTTLGGDGGWVDDPARLLHEADVVVTHAGQNALAEAAASRRPVVVVPQVRPHDEQLATAAVLRDGDWPAVVLDAWPRDDGPLEQAVALDGSGWSGWCDGRAVERYAAVVCEVAAR
ncbi:glycosyltransferase [Nocardioides rubriscoriae]|uniref:glycosyltransferase n=1 Tax=Nocardioides rubriscoriae TaxID=642762 RepID=UPI0011DF8CA0|nr:glycosyltransferase [Nocardioides rubriscoriae]